jgi:hypothetical protein
MIVDVHTHAMRAAEHLSDAFVREADRAWGYPVDLTVTVEAYLRAMGPVDRCVVDKILFGSDYPFTTPGDSITGLRALNNMVEGTHLPRVEDATLDEIIHRPSLMLLGLT